MFLMDFCEGLLWRIFVIMSSSSPSTQSMLFSSKRRLASKQGEKIELCCVPLWRPQAILILMLLAQYRFSLGGYGNKVCYPCNKQTYIGDMFVCYKGSVLFCPPTYSMLLASARWLASKRGEKIELCCVPLRRPQAILILMLLAQFGGIL